MRAAEAIARARELGASPAATEASHRLGVPVWPVQIALEAALEGKATESEIQRFFDLLRQKPKA